MKKIFAILAIFLSTNSYAQQKDTTIGVLIDTIYNINIDNTVDTVLSMNWVAYSVSPDPGTPCMVVVRTYNRYGKQIGIYNVNVPGDVVDAWGTNRSVIDDWIFYITRLKRKK